MNSLLTDGAMGMDAKVTSEIKAETTRRSEPRRPHGNQQQANLEIHESWF